MSNLTHAPRTDAELPAFLAALGVPGLADIHIHFLPESMQQKVWAYFDAAGDNYGRPWPIYYREDEATRIAILSRLGVQAIPALTYAHRAGMAQWLNEWSADFAARIPQAVHCATFYPEPGVGAYTASAIATGARLFKIHAQVGNFAPDDPRLEAAWTLLAQHQLPVVVHCGSAPLPGEHTGPASIERLLARHPDLVLVIAHLGMPEYDAFADLAAAYPGVYLDTTMAGTDFANTFAPMSRSYIDRLGGLADKVVLGSDFPSIPYPYAEQIAALARFGLGDDWLRAVLWTNGARLLGLAGDEP